MWRWLSPFSRRLAKGDLEDVKTIWVNSFKFKIRKINPLLDFPSDKMPQIFTDFTSRRQRKEEPGIDQARRQQRDMYTMIEAGLVDPKLVPIGLGEKRGKEDGLTVEDVFRDADVGAKLYFEILAHSLCRFRGMKGVFFSTLLKRRLYTAWQKSLANDLATSSSATGSLA